MRRAVALLALVVLAGVGALVALGQAPGRSPQGVDETTATNAVSDGSTVSSRVVVQNTASCSVSVTSVNGVATIMRSGDCSANGACSVSVSSVNGVATTTESGTCPDTTHTTPVGSAGDPVLLRALVSNLLVWFRFVAGM